MHLGRSIVESKRPNIAIDARDCRIVTGPTAAHYLQGAIDHCAEFLRAIHFARAHFTSRFFALIEQPSGMSRGQGGSKVVAIRRG